MEEGERLATKQAEMELTFKKMKQQVFHTRLLFDEALAPRVLRPPHVPGAKPRGGARSAQAAARG